MAARKQRFYVYRIFDLGGTIYIGKGSGRRLRQQISRFGCMGEVIERFAVEKAAYAREKQLINQLKPIRNRHPGGNGSRAQRIYNRREKWEILCDHLGTQVYAARELLRFDLTPFLPASKIERIRQVAHGCRA